ncbi:leucyl aminopeptidase [Candidatus Entotheonella serta]|nr:leucyl aminopeptidase [Candidatus Entotheonella serta]
MKITVKRDKFDKSKADVLIVPVYQDAPLDTTSVVVQLDNSLDGLVSDYLDSRDFSGALNSTTLLRTRGRISAPRVLLVGLGKLDVFTVDHLRQASASAATTVQKLGASTMTMLLPTSEFDLVTQAQAITEGTLLGLYSLKTYKSVEDENNDKAQLSELQLLASGGSAQQKLNQGVKRGETIAKAVSLARDLSNSPGNDINPSYLANTAKEIAKKTSLKCKILSQDDMKKFKMGCLLGVAQGSVQPPVLIMLDHAPNGPSETPVVLLGKGITFDSGGISIKPAANMEDMKMDMSGGAAVLGAMQALAELEHPRRVVGLVPASENLPSGEAIKPGDIIRAMSGKTVEVINTDAEGRLVLADALSYAVEHLKPERMIDLATLTGAVVIALGAHASGMMGTDEDMMAVLKASGEQTAERVWQLPLFEDYSQQIKSDFADIKNVGGREAGSITGGAFLKEFVGDVPWVHLDIAGTAWTRASHPYVPKGATGVGIRLLIHALETLLKPEAEANGTANAKVSSNGNKPSAAARNSSKAKAAKAKA